MPLYSYGCYDCKKDFEVRHGMFFENQRCLHCNSENVFRYPQGNYIKSEIADTNHNRPGAIVDKYIEDVKKEVKKEKEKLKKESL